MEEIVETNKLKLTSYYLNGMALYWHHNFMSTEGQLVTWNEYVEIMCSRSVGQKNPLEEFKDPKQLSDLETYIKDFESYRTELISKL